MSFHGESARLTLTGNSSSKNTLNARVAANQSKQKLDKFQGFVNKRKKQAKDVKYKNRWIKDYLNMKDQQKLLEREINELLTSWDNVDLQPMVPQIEVSNKISQALGNKEFLIYIGNELLDEISVLSFEEKQIHSQVLEISNLVKNGFQTDSPTIEIPPEIEGEDPILRSHFVNALQHLESEYREKLDTLVLPCISSRLQEKLRKTWTENQNSLGSREEVVERVKEFTPSVDAAKRLVSKYEEMIMTKKRRSALKKELEQKQTKIIREMHSALNASAISFHEKKKNEEERNRLNAKRETLHKELQEKEAQKAQQEQFQEEEMQREKQKLKIREKRKQKRQQKELELKKEQLKEYHLKKEEEKELQAKVEQDKMKNELKERQRQAKINAERVQVRQNLQEQKEKEKEQRKEEQMNEIQAKEHRLEKLRSKVRSKIDVDIDPERLLQPTSALTQKQTSDSSALFPVYGYRDNEITSDIRHRLAVAFQEAGLETSNYAKQVLASMAHPRVDTLTTKEKEEIK